MKKTKQKFGEMRDSREIKNRNEINIYTRNSALGRKWKTTFGATMATPI